MTTAAKTDTRKDLSKDKYGTRIVNMTVKAKDGAMVYDSNGSPIPGDTFVTVPVSATLVRALQAGDLEEAEEEKPAPEPKPSESTRRTSTTAAKTTE